MTLKVSKENWWSRLKREFHIILTSSTVSAVTVLVYANTTDEKTVNILSLTLNVLIAAIIASGAVYLLLGGIYACFGEDKKD